MSEFRTIDEAVSYFFNTESNQFSLHKSREWVKKHVASGAISIGSERLASLEEKLFRIIAGK